MPRYAAFLRGVMPTNARMPELRRAFESAGFEEVRTLLASGNVLFTAGAASPKTLERRAESAMRERLGRSFLTIVRSVDSLRELLASDPFASFRSRAGEKRIITFLRKPPEQPVALPIRLRGVRILSQRGCEVFTTYVRDPNGPDFMRLIEQTFGKEQTTRTWDTVARAAR